MNQNINKSSRIIRIAALGAVLLVLALVLFTTQNRKRITSENREYLIDSATQVAETIDAAISDGYDNIRILSELVSASLDGPSFDIASIQELITNSVFDFMEFADKDGMDHNITGGVSDARDRLYYLDAKAGHTGMELIYVSRATHETLLMFYSPIYYDDEFVGSLVGVYQAANRITKLLSTEYFGEPATSYLATHEGRIIASNQGFDPENKMFITDLAGGNEEACTRLEEAQRLGEMTTFALTQNTTGGCIKELPESGFFLVQIFPQEASNRMIQNANALGYGLVAFLVLLFALFLFLLIRFYRHQQKLVEDARSQAEMANMAKTNFLFNMSHDIRTPMNAITGFTDKAIRHKDNPAVLEESLEKVQQSSYYLLGIVNDILDMAKIESNKLELKEELRKTAQDEHAIIEVFSADAARKDIKFHTAFKGIVHRYLWIDQMRYNQIVANLISNSIKYTNPGGDIWFTEQELPCEREGYARMRTIVRDNGRGMSPEFVEKIFEAFEREQSATQSGEQGTGLGMAIVKKLVDAMGGTIDVKSEQGAGTTIQVVTMHRIATADEIAAYEAARAFSAGETHLNLKGKRVLLVEDNELNREIATDLLEEEGLLVESASDGDIAVDRIRELIESGETEYYAAILMDVQMPRMNGYDATRAIRGLEKPLGLHMPIIAMTANAFEEDRQNAFEAGMDEHIAKPIDVPKLWNTLSRFM